MSLQCGAAQWCCSAMLLCGVECGEQDFAQVLQLKHVLQCVVVFVVYCILLQSVAVRMCDMTYPYGVATISRLLEIIGLFCERVL